MENLPKVIQNRKKRVGRGYGSGKGGHTVGRGQKGQKSRGKVHILFEGVKVKKSLLRRLPVRRGKEKLKSLLVKPLVLNVEALNLLKDGQTVTVSELTTVGIVKLKDAVHGIKILGNGKLEKKLVVKLPTSKSAAKKIIEAGGKIE